MAENIAYCLELTRINGVVFVNLIYLHVVRVGQRLHILVLALLMARTVMLQSFDENLIVALDLGIYLPMVRSCCKVFYVKVET